MSPLHGTRIIDMTSVLMGPFASQTLADMGADVIKIEAPVGDVVRQIGPARHAGMGPIFLNTNRNKRSVVLDLKHPEGVAALKRLLVDADVLMYNVRPQAMARLGLDYDSVRAINPRLVYAGLFGFGQDGPYAARPAYDDLIQGAATLPHLMARASGDIPRYVPTAMADRIVGQTAVGAILASLLARGRTGQGDRVDIPMFETMVGFVLGDHLGGLTSIRRWMRRLRAPAFAPAALPHRMATSAPWSTTTSSGPAFWPASVSAAAAGGRALPALPAARSILTTCTAGWRRCSKSAARPNGLPCWRPLTCPSCPCMTCTAC
jgi:crotonobetainyl-CoA:carnitine CoA-transferase CaiB-like acyl-CoA transferase